MPPLQVEWENAELKGQLLGVKQERDSALRKSQGLQSKLESLEQVLKVSGSRRRCDETAGGTSRGSGSSPAACPLSLPVSVSFFPEAGGSRGPPPGLRSSVTWWSGKLWS